MSSSYARLIKKRFTKEKEQNIKETFSIFLGMRNSRGTSWREITIRVRGFLGINNISSTKHENLYYFRKFILNNIRFRIV